jgi:hypothetical protein
VRALFKGGDDTASQGKVMLKFGGQWAALCDASSGVGQRSTELRQNGYALLEYGQLASSSMVSGGLAEMWARASAAR